MPVIATAPTRPVTWVFAPARSATAVREPLVLTGNPWKKPAAMFAAPMPIISRLPSTRWFVRAAKADAVEIVSASDTSAIPAAPTNSGPRSLRSTFGNRGAGKPWGRVPTSETPWEARSNTCATTIDRITATSTPGTFGSHRSSRRITARAIAPTASAAPTASPLTRPFTNAPASRTSPLASVEKPNSFGSWPTRIVRARPFM
jgi:hypothetical protein